MQDIVSLHDRLESFMKIIIIGAGPAGVTAAETVRSFDRQVRLAMLTEEPYLPYSPPAMADHFIQKTDHHLWRSPDWLDQMDVDYQSGVKVAAIEPEAHRVRLVSGELLPYDRLLICSGARLYAPIAGSDMAGIYNFKSLSAAENLVSKVRAGQAHSALIVGAGFIGMEIALLLRELGVQVTQIEMLDQVMASMLDAETAAVALSLMRSHGIDLRLKTKANAFIGNGQPNGVRLESGEVLQADLLIAATGVKPNLDLLEGNGIISDWGIKVDNHLRTSAPDVFAAGDCIETPDLLTGEISVHAIFPNAVEQGRIAGMNLAGYPIAYEGAERMNSLKHLGLPIMAAGDKQGDCILREQRENNLRTIYLQENRVVGFQLVGDIHAAGVLHALMVQKSDVRPLQSHLLEPNFGEGTLAWRAMTAYL
jgi:NADPH-dependent 2,4-dienoyl-CoA reductase/sulfur reductase-like enzyme